MFFRIMSNTPNSMEKKQFFLFIQRYVLKETNTPKYFPS